MSQPWRGWAKGAGLILAKGYGGNSLNDYLSFEFIYFKGSGCLAHPSLNVIILILWILVAE